MKQITLLINSIIGPVSAKGLGPNIGKCLFGAMEFTFLDRALLFRRIVHTNLFVGRNVLITATLVASTILHVFVTGRINQDIQIVVFVEPFVVAFRKEIALLLGLVVGVRRALEFRVSFTFGLAFFKRAIGLSRDVVRADFVVLRSSVVYLQWRMLVSCLILNKIEFFGAYCTYRRLILVATALLASIGKILKGLFACWVLHGIQGVVFIPFGVVAPTKNVT